MAKVIQYLQPSSSAADQGPTATDADNVRAELSAMQEVATALARLPDEAACLRVLNWAGEIFRAQEPKPLAVDHVAAEDLSFGSAEELFRVHPAREHARRSAAPAGEADEPVVSMIHGFVADFQKLARDWKES